MRIVIDARFYGPPGKGLGRYVQKLIEHLEPIVTDDDVVVLLRKDNWNEFVPTNHRFSKALADFRWYSVEEQLKLPRLLRSLSPDLVHFPHYNVPLLYRNLFIVTVHDLILSSHPTERATTLGPLRYALKHAAYHRVISSAVHRSKTVVTVSEYSKQEILRTFHVSPKKVVVTYEAADPVTDHRIPETIANKHQALAPYLLYVGNAYPHKNIEGLVSAFSLLLQGRSDRLRLVLVGKMDYFYLRIKTLCEKLGLADRVVFIGSVSDDELISLYRHAALYVFPSFIEGFGLPALEAMVAGVPVASSNRSCLPEILGDAAAYFDPEKPYEIAAVCRRLLDHPEERRMLRECGKARAARFSWERLARTTLSVYTEAVRRTT